MRHFIDVSRQNGLKESVGMQELRSHSALYLNVSVRPFGSLVYLSKSRLMNHLYYIIASDLGFGS